MNQILALVLLSVLIVASGAKGADKPLTLTAREKRVELLSVLRSDLARAMPQAKLDQKQDRKLREARKRLEEAEASLRKGGMLNPFKMLKMKGALGDIEELAQGDTFRPEDRQRLQQDIKNIKETRQSENRE